MVKQEKVWVVNSYYSEIGELFINCAIPAVFRSRQDAKRFRKEAKETKKTSSNFIGFSPVFEVSLRKIGTKSRK